VVPNAGRADAEVVASGTRLSWTLDAAVAAIGAGLGTNLDAAIGSGRAGTSAPAELGARGGGRDRAGRTPRWRAGRPGRRSRRASALAELGAAIGSAELPPGAGRPGRRDRLGRAGPRRRPSRLVACAPAGSRASGRVAIAQTTLRQ
jgi:hypothetical protein